MLTYYSRCTILFNSCAHMNSYLFKLLTFVERSVCSPRPTPQSEKQPAQLEKLHECTSPLHWSIVVDSWPAPCMHGLLCAMSLEMCHFLTHATFYTPDMITACIPAMLSVLLFPGKSVVLIPSMSHTHEHPA